MLKYKVLTFLIMVLARLRRRVTGGRMGLVKNSPLIKDEIPFRYLDEERGILIECCDCGLEHRFFKAGLCLGVWPLRPTGYDYSWRV